MSSILLAENAEWLSLPQSTRTSSCEKDAAVMAAPDDPMAEDADDEGGGGLAGGTDPEALDEANMIPPFRILW